MNLYTEEQHIVVTCNRRLSPFLAIELEKLGFNDFKTSQTAIELKGTMADCIKLNVNLRCASQVLLSLGTFDCYDPDDLYHYVSRINWANFITEDTYFSITSSVFTETINNNLFANVRVKDAIVDYFKKKSNTRPDTGPSKDFAVIHLRWNNEKAELFLDTSGETLAKHGYRKLPGTAPMLESLAISTILASEWNTETDFINPMCGSGTLAIEAALLASRRVPGLLRNNYAFMHYVGYQPHVYADEIKLAQYKIKEKVNCKIIASDISNQAIEISRQNAEYAGVQDLISFEVCDFRDSIIPQDNKGVVIINPEYGERLGEIEDLETTYKDMGDFMKQKCKGYFAFIFTGNLDLAKLIGLKASRRIEFFNAKIDCRLLKYELYEGSRREV